MSSSPSPPLAARLAVVVLQAGAIAVVLAALPYKTFELDRYFIPKEFALHLTAALAAVLALIGVGRYTLRRVDLALIGFLALSLISALFADNWWLASRALAVSASGAAIFWVARTLGRAGLSRPLVTALALAVVLGAATALAQAYGVVSELASLSRAPGGTFGNRNFMAHLAAIGTPALVLAALQARTRLGVALGGLGLAIVAAALVLSRTRAAWLALMVCGAAIALVWFLERFRRRWPDGALAGRLVALTALAAVGVGGALLIPNALNWKSDNPYVESVKGVVNFKEGSGRGRVIQYRTSARMALTHPLLGVGPGNWPVDYPAYAAPNDPSLSQSDGMTANPWPSSDWVAYLAERGVPAVLLLVFALAGLASGAAVRAWTTTSRGEFLTALTLAATIAIAVIVGAFDAVLLLAPPTLVVWGLVGALSASLSSPASGHTVELGRAERGRWIAAVALVGLLATVRTGAQLRAMALFHLGTRTRELELASRLDPGSYRMHMRLAAYYAERGDCKRVRTHAGAARALFPHAGQPRRLLRGCGIRAAS